MGDAWFTVADVDHFWIRRRFEVLCALFGSQLREGVRVAEVGCGSGLVQRQLEQELGVAVDGFDLNAAALARNPARAGRLYCYDVHARDERLRAAYEVVLLLDVIEHVEADREFTSDAAFLARAGGHLVVNVPALPSLFSRYDEAAGHLRRYTPRALLEVGRACGLETVSWSYWGLPLLPLAIARKGVVRRGTPGQVLRAGFAPPSARMGRALASWARLERLPQHWLGTSLMAVFRKGRP
jgi:SAM-dependent methyltransferase